MPLLLRTVRANRWLKAEAEPFLAVDDVPADSLGDLVTHQHLLSVWEVARDRSNIERIVRAIAIGRDKIDSMGYVVFDSGFLNSANIEILANKGKSLDEVANHWHRDLVLSGNKLVALTSTILRHGESGTILKARLCQLLADGIRDGQIPEKLREKL